MKQIYQMSIKRPLLSRQIIENNRFFSPLLDYRFNAPSLSLSPDICKWENIENLSVLCRCVMIGENENGSIKEMWKKQEEISWKRLSFSFKITPSVKRKSCAETQTKLHGKIDNFRINFPSRIRFSWTIATWCWLTHFNIAYNRNQSEIDGDWKVGNGKSISEFNINPPWGSHVNWEICRQNTK